MPDERSTSNNPLASNAEVAKKVGEADPGSRGSNRDDAASRSSENLVPGAKKPTEDPSQSAIPPRPHQPTPDTKQEAFATPFRELIEEPDPEFLRVCEDTNTPPYPRNPLVLCHGLLGFDTLGPVNYWWGIAKTLNAVGCTNIHITKVPPTAHVQIRATALALQIRTLCKMHGYKKVNVIGHSMGGLDARWMISKLDGGEFVSSLTTIGTPHLGSPFADWAIENIGNRLRAAAILKMVGIKTEAFYNLQPAAMVEFNKEVQNVEGVEYMSLGSSKIIPIWSYFGLPYRVVTRAEGPNDGLVSLQSARWGRYLGTIRNCDHLQQIGWGVKSPRMVYLHLARFLASLRF